MTRQLMEGSEWRMWHVGGKRQPAIVPILKIMNKMYEEGGAGKGTDSCSGRPGPCGVMGIRRGE